VIRHAHSCLIVFGRVFRQSIVIRVSELRQPVSRQLRISHVTRNPKNLQSRHFARASLTMLQQSADGRHLDNGEAMH